MENVIPIKYAFPLFTKHNSTDYLIKNDHIRVSDIWAFWKYIIERYVKKYKGNKDFLLTLLEQAKYFYTAAESAPIKSQPLLYYYSFLNIVKVVINVNSLNIYGPHIEYFHGVESCKINKGDTLKNHYVEILGLIGAKNKLSVAYQFMTQMGDSIPVPPKFKIDILKLLQSCIGIHRTFSETHNCKETYFQIKFQYLYRVGKNFVARYIIKECNDNIKLDLINQGYNIVAEERDDGLSDYFWEESIQMISYKPTKFDYYKLAKKLRDKGIWYFTDGNQYREFISSDKISISTESIIYLLMFFFGSITRYHPYMFDNLLSDRQMWIIGEFLKTQPKQFLHIITSKTIECAILKPNTVDILV